MIIPTHIELNDRLVQRMTDHHGIVEFTLLRRFIVILIVHLPQDVNKFLTQLLPPRLEICVQIFIYIRQCLFFLILLGHAWSEMHFLALDIAPNVHKLIWYIHFLDYIESFPRCEIMRAVAFIISTLSS